MEKQRLNMNSGHRSTRGVLNILVFAAFSPRSSSLDSEVESVDVSELGCEETKQAEEQHDQDPLTHSSSGGIADVMENGHCEGGGGSSQGAQR